MTVERRRDWGSTGPLPDDGVVVPDDREASRVVEAAWRDGRSVPPLGLAGGDLCRTLGGSGDHQRLRGPAAQQLPCDVGVATLDGVERVFVAHLVIRGTWWRGPVVAVMNAQFIGAWDVAPRGHPNDGRLDVIEADPGFDERLKVWSRLRTGSHLPHPAIATRRIAEAGFEVPRGAAVHLDGERHRGVRAVTVRVEPDAVLCVV